MIQLPQAGLIAGEVRTGSALGFRACDPRTGSLHDRPFTDASPSDLTEACGAAAVAATAGIERARRADALRRAADLMEASDLIALCDAETGLGGDRLRAELARAVRQARAFAALTDAGGWLEAEIESADSTAVPPRPEMRRLRLPVGPVAVFAAGNFPLALGVAGSDTMSAIAAGCPVVVKAHPSQPGTSDGLGRILTEAVRVAGLPAGTFSMLHGSAHSIGESLVRDPRIKAVAFTGSLSGGRALFDVAATRPEPIPVFAEMGSLNPVFVLPGALSARSREIAAGLAESVAAGAGQMCTKPGLVFVPLGADGDRFEDRFVEALVAAQIPPMLDPRLAARFKGQMSNRKQLAGVKVLATGALSSAALACVVHVFRTDAAMLQADLTLLEEAFGPSTLLIRDSIERLTAAAQSLPGSLTATIHSEPDDKATTATLMATLSTRVGRLIVNGYPTGVPMGHAVHHGGPFPATTAPANTSIGMRAIDRFLRPVCFQNVPSELLPAELQDANPLRIERLIDGVHTRDPFVPKRSGSAQT